MKKVLSYMAVIVCSVIFIVTGFFYCNKNMPESSEIPVKTYKAKTLEIISDNEIFSKYTNEITERRIVYYAEILNGDRKGEEIVVTQVMDLTQMELGKSAKEGSVYFVSEITNEYMENQWIAGNPVRTPWILFLVILFIVLIVLFGRKIPLFFKNKYNRKFDIASSSKPFGIEKETLIFYDETPITFSEKEALALIEKSIGNYEKEDLQDAEIISRETSAFVRDNILVCKINYHCIEDIVSFVKINTNLNFSLPPNP